ncbi:hypothetical protein HNR74_002709, partial [Flammeovirga kamogawensis]|nr:hypothetical protein [Flammeovirga kamogawensis]
PVKNASDIEFFERENVKLNSRLLDKQDAVEKNSASRLNSNLNSKKLILKS